MTKFTDLGLAEPLLRAVTAEGYESPTPIQAKVIPPLLEGRDVLGTAQTGTGKTAAFVLPLLNQIHADGGRPASKSCRGLILTPTRELATQIAEEIRRYSKFMRASLTVVVGGVKPGPQIRNLARGVDIVVATPGRLLDHLQTGAIDLSLTKFVVLDEADQMLDLGFLPPIKKILAKVPRSRQTALLSATMPNEIRGLAAQFQKDPAEVAVAPVSRPIEQIEQSVIAADASTKKDVLAKLLTEADVTRAIVFCRTKHGSDKLTKHLNNVGLRAVAIHGNKSQNQRERALDDFKKGETPILVATDIAARGIHVNNISHVFNYELPEVAEVYVHRIGRTARAGTTGIAVSLCDPAERKLLRAIERLTNIPLTRAGGTTAGFLADEPDRSGPSRNSRRRPGGGNRRPGGPGGRPQGASRGEGRGRSPQAAYN
ncbi:DEAD/DEAH box helicase [Acuticoccus sp. MNP-M23]|uniref:DEAD/DEAH box helicase n=1 Tax=Acuticoccus sp. MNP-M23 TaxID=3072793 RepID=UPI002814A4C1|nr:DEAD/DEAH box helicase [Acuticoccus sp. MNP-M23]WMS42553.1 DEAD/DEAH box helicase [Acuticoccus sp. MNP-M23]